MTVGVFCTPDMVARAALCPAEVPAGPAEVVARDYVELVLVRSGCFEYRDRRGRSFVDAATCVMSGPLEVAEMRHPVPGGDTTTILLLAPEILDSLGAGVDHVPLAAHVAPAVQVAHRRLLAAARRGDDVMTLQEVTLDIVAAVLTSAEPERPAATHPATDRARRQLADDARAVLAADPGVASVVELAAEVSCSPHHLSRVFRQCTGTTLGAYRQHLRVNRALELLADGAPDVTTLADVAARCGFADHAHLTRSLRRFAGVTPAALRAEFA